MHGLDHEDMTGEISKVPLSDHELLEIMKDCAAIIKERIGKVPKGFRAPYMRTNEKVMNALRKTGIKYDSSLYAELEDTMLPYEIYEGIKEIPVPVTTDSNRKKMHGYLWQMHESIRKPDEYIRMSTAVKNGVFVLATHSWHIVESRKGMMDPEQKNNNIKNLYDVITGILDSGSKAVRMCDVL
jgi:peptidoglycan/xylan/chitin deacetylase (PgdA/CDA1 family)